MVLSIPVPLEGGLLGLDELRPLGLEAHELGILSKADLGSKAELPLLTKPENPLKELGLVRGRLRGMCGWEVEFEPLVNPVLIDEGGTRGKGLIALGATIPESLF